MKKLPLCTLKTRFYLIVRIHVFQSNLSHFPFISLIARFAPDLGPGSPNRLNVNIQFSHRFTVHVVPKRQTASDGRIEVPADQCSSIPFWNTTCFHVQVMTLTEEHLLFCQRYRHRTLMIWILMVTFWVLWCFSSSKLVLSGSFIAKW